MFRWNKEKLIDLACIDDLTVPDIAAAIGASVSAVEKQLRLYREEIDTARNALLISDRMLLKVLDMWGDGLTSAEIAVATGLGIDTVRRLILSAEYDEAPESTGADAELAALEREHPDRLYEDDVAALTEYGAWKRPPTFALAADTGLRQAA